ncbi:hypothetical protein ACTGV6_10930, partial [Streptococcus suis]
RVEALSRAILDAVTNASQEVADDLRRDLELCDSSLQQIDALETAKLIGAKSADSMRAELERSRESLLRAGTAIDRLSQHSRIVPKRNDCFSP